jgi:hypothetical protein
MPDNPDGKETSPPELSERLKNCLTEIQSLIKQGVEHSHYEFKRSTSLSRDNFDDRLDFIKLIQGVANAESSQERYIVVGADPADQQFYPVTNAAEFDQARVTPILEKYLDPVPNIEIFNNLHTDSGDPLIVIIFNAVQNRPIVIKTEAKKQDGKTRLQVGDIWIKRGTGLQLITRADLDLMYRQRMEEESEDRARKRFKHFTEISAPRTSGMPPSRIPVRELLVGPATDFQGFVNELIADSDEARFSMLIELIRESLVEGWNKQDIQQPFPQDLKSSASALGDFFRDEYLPALQSLVSACLTIIKHNGKQEWIVSAVQMLTEAFEESRDLRRLKSEYYGQLTGTLQWWRPAFEIFIAFRCVAIYAVMRDRPRFLAPILQCRVVPIRIDHSASDKAPILFWPLPSNMFTGGELMQGRSAFFWTERISASWGAYFGTYEKYIAAACQLELLLEFNSYLGNSVNESELKKWLDANAGDLNFYYVPDLFSNSLELTVPMAERCYDVVAAQERSSPSQYEITPFLFAAVFGSKNLDQRQIIYGGFLDKTKAWQSQTMMQQFQRFPFMFTWQDRLGSFVKKYRDQLQKKP